jgi:hypothetical protein
MKTVVVVIMKIDTGASKIRAMVVINAILRGFPSGGDILMFCGILICISDI